MAKLKANSQWGYLAMNLDKTQFKIINDLNEWNSMLVDNQYVIKNVDFVDESSALMVQCIKDFFIGGVLFKGPPFLGQFWYHFVDHFLNTFLKTF